MVGHANQRQDRNEFLNFKIGASKKTFSIFDVSLLIVGFHVILQRIKKRDADAKIRHKKLSRER